MIRPHISFTQTCHSLTYVLVTSPLLLSTESQCICGFWVCYLLFVLGATPDSAQGFILALCQGSLLVRLWGPYGAEYETGNNLGWRAGESITDKLALHMSYPSGVALIIAVPEKWYACLECA